MLRLFLFWSYKAKLARLYKKEQALKAKTNYKILPGSEAEQAVLEIDRYIEEEYSAAVFSYYQPKAPDLITIQNGEVITWEKAFGHDFRNVSKSLRHSLVGLVEGEGRYKFK